MRNPGHITDLMWITLDRLSKEPQALITMERREMNRAYALMDKGLVKVRYGKARPTLAGLELLANRTAA